MVSAFVHSVGRKKTHASIRNLMSSEFRGNFWKTSLTKAICAGKTMVRRPISITPSRVAFMNSRSWIASSRTYSSKRREYEEFVSTSLFRWTPSAFIAWRRSFEQSYCVYRPKALDPWMGRRTTPSFSANRPFRALSTKSEEVSMICLWIQYGS